MTEHDLRCEGPDDQKVLDGVAGYGWHVVKIFEQEGTRMAFSIGLFHNFGHPEIVVFGLDPDLMHSIINSEQGSRLKWTTIIRIWWKHIRAYSRR